MNTIIIDEEEIIQNKCNKNIVVEYVKRTNVFGINKLVLNIEKDSDITINIKSDNSKYNITINLLSGINTIVNSILSGDKSKIQFTYNINSKSLLTLNKYDNCTNYKEMNIINLNNSSKVILNQSGISITRDSYDIIVNHNDNKSNSIINHNLVCFDPGRILLQLTNNVDDSIINTSIKNNNNILDLSRYQCEIKPNLYINNCKTNIDEEQHIINNIHDKKEIINYILNNIDNKSIKKSINDYLDTLGGDIYQ